MAQTLSQVVGRERHARKKDNEVGISLAKQVQVPNLINGYSKVFKKKDDDILPEHYGHDEYKEVALTVHDALAEASRYAAEALDLIATKDKTNQSANADLTIQDVTFKNVPISHLLALDTYLTEWRKKFIEILPVLDQTRRWSEDEQRQGLHRSAPEITDRTVPDKVVVSLTKATDKHPERAELIDKKVFVGTWENVVLSGAIPADRKKKLLDNADQAIAAVKDAISRANHTQAVEVTEGRQLMSLLLA